METQESEGAGVIARPAASAATASGPSADARDVLVEVRGLTKHYGDIRAVDGIDFVVRRGDVLAFLGPNGAGKTTAMKMITGFLEPDAGAIEVVGEPMTRQATSVRRRIGYLPENAPAYGEMTAQSFLEFVADARDLADAPAAIERVVRLTGLASVRHQVIETLSKGYKRRVGLAQALIHDPEVLILDEPTDGLDPNQKAMVQELISSLAAGRAIVVSTHILDEAERICNRALILSEGRILVDSTPQELMARAPNHNVIELRIAHGVPVGLVERLRAQPWCESATVRDGDVLEVRSRHGENHLADVLELASDADVRDVKLHEGRLDDLFRQVTKGVAA
jgi:ABC-2 type transport system ATP-binding protein